MGSDKKWIYLSYILLTLLFAWLLHQALTIVFAYARWDNPMVLNVLPLTAVVSAAVMGVSAYFYFRQEKIFTFSTEVMQEVRKVTWPERKAVYMSTIIVIISVMIVAAILGVFDWVCIKLVGLVIGT